MVETGENVGDAGESDDARLAEALISLPVFPLPGTVFFPHTLLPLHIFEPRYRQLTEHVLAGHGYMAIALIDDAHDDSIPRPDLDVARTSVSRVAGLGKLVHHERLPDGRFHILLQGVGRVRLIEELSLSPLLYRRMRTSLVPAAASKDPAAVARELATMRRCYQQLLDVQPDVREVLGDLPMRIDEPAIVADIIAAALFDDVAVRQRALEAEDLTDRMRMANEALAALVLRHMPTDGMMN
jgi:uncharacterized protein